MCLRDDVLNDVNRFLGEYADNFADDLAEERGFHDLDWIEDGPFHETIVDRAYTLLDAATILAEVENEETDRGLWEGQDPEDAICTKAAFSYGNDVRMKLKEVYEELLETFQDRIAEIEDQEPDTEPDRSALAEQVIADYGARFDVQPLETVAEKIQVIRRWLLLNDNAGMRGGYPCSGSYIDARCGSGHGMPEVKEYIAFDHKAARLVPEIAGKYRRDVEAVLSKLVSQQSEA